MKKYVINGKFSSERMQGIVRYATEITIALDKILDNYFEVVLLVPSSTENIPTLKHIKNLSGDKGLRDRYGIASAERCKNNFLLDQYKPQIEKVIHSLENNKK